MNYGQRTCVIVVGMHRSGTSVLAAVLRSLGVSFGDRLIAPWHDNPKGYVEHVDVLHENAAFLESFGLGKDGLQGELPVDWYTDERTIQFKERIKEILVREFSNEYIFGIKDPRISLLLPVYLEVLQDMQVNVKCVVAKRNIAEVAASLEKRNDLSLYQAIRAYQYYYTMIDSALDGVATITVTYDDVLHQTQSVVSQLGKTVHPSLRPFADVATELQALVDPALRHHEANEQTLLIDLAASVDRLQQDLQRLRHVREQDILWWQERIDTFTSLAQEQQELIARTYDERVDVQKANQELEDALELLQRTYETFKHKTHQAHVASEKHRDHLEKVLAERDAHITQLDTTIANIERSVVWKFVKGWDIALALILPKDTVARRMYESFVRWNQRMLNEWLPNRVLAVLKRSQHKDPKISVDGFWKRFNVVHKETDVLFVNHEESRTGAPRIVFDVAAHMKEHVRVAMVSLSGGSMRRIFENTFSQVIHPDELYPHMAAYEQAKEIITQVQPKVVYVNSIGSHMFARAAKELGIPVIFHVHELDIAFRIVFSKRERETFKELADVFIAVSQSVYDLLVHKLGCDQHKVQLLHAFVNRERITRESGEVPAASVQSELRHEPHEVLIMGLGMFIYRKGADIFMQAAKRLHDKGLQCRFVWIGSRPFKEPFMADFNEYAAHFSLIQEKENPFPYLKAADIFVLPSREDPFPLVALEAMALGKPVITFKEAGSMGAAIGDAGIVVDETTVDAFTDALESLVLDTIARQTLGARGPLQQLPYDSSVLLPKIEKVVMGLLKS